MDAYTRLRLEIEGYRELGMWEEAHQLLEELASGIPKHPEIMAYLVMLDVALVFGTGGPTPLPAYYLPTMAHVKSEWGRAELAAL